MEEDTEGLSLWQRVIKTVKAYDFKHNRLYLDGIHTIVHKNDIKQVLKQTPDKKSSAIKLKQPPQLDKSTKKKLASGDIRPDAKLDLHNMNQEQAYNSLLNFVDSSIKNGKRTLLVITGKGKNFKGVLRNNFMLWLEKEELKKHIVTIMPAAKKDGGDGAFYIRLKNANKNKRL